MDLVTLPKTGRLLADAFDLHKSAPTPSYRLAASVPSLAAVRVRPLRREHVLEMRTLWLDAFLIELVQRESLAGLTVDLQALSPEADKDWLRLDAGFRAWRTRWSWQASTDTKQTHDDETQDVSWPFRRSGIAVRVALCLATRPCAREASAAVDSSPEARVAASGRRVQPIEHR